jgi:hypothetical protein
MNQKARWAEICKTQLDVIRYDERFNSIENKRSNRPDLHAFLLLDSLFPGTNDMVAGAAHDEIFLDVHEDQIALLTDAEILELMKCGVRYGEDCLCMFA